MSKEIEKIFFENIEYESKRIAEVFGIPEALHQDKYDKSPITKTIETINLIDLAKKLLNE